MVETASQIPAGKSTRKNGNGEPILVLSIRRIHAARIFQGTKRYELRKRLPSESFKHVFLYQSGGAGIIGCFDVADLICAPIADLWNRVGEAAAPEERFNKYFEGRLLGFAIKIANPVKFARPIFPAALRRRVPSFNAPMSFLILKKADRLYETLERKRKAETRGASVSLQPITQSRHHQYEKLVTQVISSRYDDITSAFARAALRSHRLGRDPNGIFTIRKCVLEIHTAAHAIVGFTTLTFKIGGSVKTGPTVLFSKHRRKGYGQATRGAIEEYVRQFDVRKLYCTCPDNDTHVISYLLRAGYRIEAHLASHYRVDNGELVFGKLIQELRNSRTDLERSHHEQCEIVDVNYFEQPALAVRVAELFEMAGFPVDKIVAANIVKAGRAVNGRAYEDKPLRLFCLASSGICVGVLLFVPKRGGAVKLVCASATGHVPSIRKLIASAEIYAKNIARRKLYFLQPHNDFLLSELLRTLGYAAEGVLREPYRSGIDCIVLSKLV